MADAARGSGHCRSGRSRGCHPPDWRGGRDGGAGLRFAARRSGCPPRGRGKSREGKWRVKRSVIWLAIGVLLAAPATAPAQPASELRVAIPWTPENLDPTMNLSSIRAAVGVSIFDSLVGRAADNRIVPQLAESWRLLDDNTWQLRLRRGVIFHDGESFNAEAVRFTFHRVLDPEQRSPNRATIAEIVRVDIVDDLTVNLVTRQPYAPLINRLLDFPMLPPKYTTEKGNQGMRS